MRPSVPTSGWNEVAINDPCLTATILPTAGPALTRESTSMTFLLALPAIVVTACFFVIWFGIEDVRGVSTGGIDYVLVGTEEPLANALRAYLHKRERLG